MGASRTRMVGFLAEPVFMIVFFTVSFVAGSTILYIVQETWMTPLANFFMPAHVLLVLAFLMLICFVETFPKLMRLERDEA